MSLFTFQPQVIGIAVTDFHRHLHVQPKEDELPRSIIHDSAVSESLRNLDSQVANEIITQCIRKPCIFVTDVVGMAELLKLDLFEVKEGFRAFPLFSASRKARFMIAGDTGVHIVNNLEQAQAHISRRSLPSELLSYSRVTRFDEPADLVYLALAEAIRSKMRVVVVGGPDIYDLFTPFYTEFHWRMLRQTSGEGAQGRIVIPERSLEYSRLGCTMDVLDNRHYRYLKMTRFDDLDEEDELELDEE